MLSTILLQAAAGMGIAKMGATIGAGFAAIGAGIGSGRDPYLDVDHGSSG